MKNSRATARRRTELTKNLVGFMVGEVRYAVEIFRVREIVNPLVMVDLPHASEEVIGVADHRGVVLPVVNLRVRFGLERVEATRRTKWLVIESGSDEPVALVVDQVTDVFGAGDEAEREVPSIGGGEDQRGIAAVVKHTDGLVFVIDPARIASAAKAVDRLSARAAISGGD